MTKLITKEEAVINEVISIIEESKKKVVSYVNTTLLFTYWNIGKLIVEYQGEKERAKYGDKLIERLSIELTKEYGGAFNKSSLWRMIQFYECFPIVASVKRELSWTHYRYIMRVDSLEARAKYGDRLIERLSIELISRYGSGFTKSNLKRMRQFYEYFPISHSLSDQLSWTHYKYIITVKNSLARDYYIGE